MNFPKKSLSLSKLSILHSFALLISACSITSILSYAIAIHHHFFFALLCIFIFITCSFLFPTSFSEFRNYFTVNKLVFSVVLCLCFSTSFYRNALRSESLQNLFYLYSLPFQKNILFLSIAGWCISVYYVLFAICAFAKHLKWRQELLVIKKTLLSMRHFYIAAVSLFFLYLLSATTIIRADVQYVDDMFRTHTGDHAFTSSSRHLAGFLSQLINTEINLTDIAPLSTFLAIIFITIASLIVITSLSNKEKITFWNVIAVLPLGISPYFLECLLYRYDAPFMALSLLSNIWPILFFDANPLLYFVSVITGILVACTTYQSSLGIFPVMVILLVFCKWQRGYHLKEILPTIFLSIVGYLLSICLFKVFLMTPINTYVNSEVFPLAQLPLGIISNLKEYFRHVISDFDIKWCLCITIILCSFIVISVIESKQNRSLTAVLAIVTVILALCLSFGINIVFKGPSFYCRGMFGFSTCIAALGVICTNQRHCKFVRLGCLYLSWCLFVFSFTLGNALAEQQRYIDFRTEMVISDLHRVPALQSDATVNLQIDGYVGHSPIMDRLVEDTPVLSRLVEPDFVGGESFYGAYYFYHFFDMPPFNSVYDLNYQDLPLILDGYYHSIYGDEENLLVVLKTIY